MEETVHPLGPVEAPFEARLEALRRDDTVRRIWARDPEVWKKDASHHASILSRLGWLDAPKAMRKELAALAEFTSELKKEGFKHVLLLGMGGSSLAPEVLAKTFPDAPGLELRVLDSTVPASVLTALDGFDADKTLFIVASKSGSTSEIVSFQRHFWQRFPDGRRWAAITDPGTALEKLARESGFRRVFLNPADIGGRFSALSLFGLVPAALLGLDVERLLDRAARMADACGPDAAASDNPGAALGAAIAEGALLGRDKLIPLLPAPLGSFGSWIEQLVAESTGKEGRGIIPVDAPPGTPQVYGKDRFFVAVSLRSAPDAALRATADGLEKAANPVLRLELSDVYDIGAEFFRWEFATAVAGAVLGINPFDEPNVSESKELTKELLARRAKTGDLPEDSPAVREGELALWADAGLKLDQGKALGDWLEAHLARAGLTDFVGILAYLKKTPEVDAELEAMRKALRERRKLAVTVGYGPRFLHSIGQLYKGGPNCGVFLQVTAADPEDAPIPGEAYGFSALKDAQAAGDLLALKRHQRRAVRVHLGGDLLKGLRTLRAHVERAAARA